jgi:endoglucanase
MRRFQLAQSRRIRHAVGFGAAIVVAACQADVMTNPTGQTGTVTQTGTPVTTSSAANPLASFTFYIDQASNARKTADGWRATRPADAAEMDKIANQPVARWFGDWNTNIRGDIAAAVSAISGSGTTPLFVAYDIPQRDCGSYSAGGATSADAYRAWIDGFAAGLGGSRAVVVLEPDALAGMDCLSAADQATRLDLIHYAVTTLSNSGARVYLDAGNPTWKSAATMADRLGRAGIDFAAGFSLNVSNFYYDADNVRYGSSISALIGNKHFIVDSGRNGLGPTSDNQWCNPDGRAIGRRPTTNTGNPLVDAFLWIKTPGESDGSCNGSPAAGVWMPEYALGLAQRG